MPQIVTNIRYEAEVGQAAERRSLLELETLESENKI